MIRSLYTAASGMQAQEKNIAVISNNLANINTTGFKKDRAYFQDLMYQAEVAPGAPTSATTNSPSGILVGLGVKTSAVSKLYTQGDLTQTGNELDLAIEGGGFFQVTLPDTTTGYTRSGNFQLDGNRNIVTSDGFPLVPNVTVPTNATEILIGQDGQISYKIPGTAQLQVGSKLQGAFFPNPAGLRSIGQNIAQETTASGTAVPTDFGTNGMGQLVQKSLESSNVSVVDQVVSMITAQRAYEANSKGIQTADEMLSQALGIKR